MKPENRRFAMYIGVILGILGVSLVLTILPDPYRALAHLGIVLCLMVMLAYLLSRTV